MRAREFVINVPISIKIDGDGAEPEISSGEMEPVATDGTPLTRKSLKRKNPPAHHYDDDDDKRFVPPLQQEIELQKAENGKHSETIDDLTADEEPEEDTGYKKQVRPRY